MSAELPMLPGWDDDEPAAATPEWATPLVLELRPLAKPMTLNTALSGRTEGAQRQRAQHQKSWKGSTELAARAAGAASVINGRPAHVWLEVALERNYERTDDTNFTLPLKAALDGLVDAGCWPDDTREFIRTWGCSWVKRPGGPHLLTIAPALPGTCVHTVLGSLW